MSQTPHGMLPARLEQWFTGILEPTAARLAVMGLSANAITVLSLLFGLAAGILIGAGQLRWALLPGVLMSLCDVLDGQVAVHTQKTGAFGAILDSSLDRYTEFMILGGFAVYYGLNGQIWWVIITALALVGSYQVSYIKARAEGAGKTCAVGLLQRSERLVMLGLGALFAGWVLKAVLLLLALLTHYTAVERLLYLKKTA